MDGLGGSMGATGVAGDFPGGAVLPNGGAVGAVARGPGLGTCLCAGDRHADRLAHFRGVVYADAVRPRAVRGWLHDAGADVVAHRNRSIRLLCGTNVCSDVDAQRARRRQRSGGAALVVMAALLNFRGAVSARGELRDVERLVRPAAHPPQRLSAGAHAQRVECGVRSGVVVLCGAVRIPAGTVAHVHSHAASAHPTPGRAEAAR
eukprot:ctg_1298.g456